MDRLDSAGFCMIKDKVCWPVPSFDRQSPDYSPRRYWRGPVWLNVNWLLYHGLRRYHFDEYAARVKEAILELPRLFGFYEYFSPETGEGHGAAEFSWTAALVIELLMREGPDGSR
jgi:glycogen debranching enzyme